MTEFEKYWNRSECRHLIIGRGQWITSNHARKLIKAAWVAGRKYEKREPAKDQK